MRVREKGVLAGDGKKAKPRFLRHALDRRFDFAGLEMTLFWVSGTSLGSLLLFEGQ